MSNPKNRNNFKSKSKMDIENKDVSTNGTDETIDPNYYWNSYAHFGTIYLFAC
jgi:hypothetical protein